jgi:hypothetical protein
MRPSHEDLKRIWLYSYSRASLLEAKEWLDAMDHPDLKSLQMRAFVCATTVAYARPFTPSQITAKERVVPLKGVQPPKQLRATHENVLKFRDKVMGHKDAIAAKGDLKSPNSICIRRDADGFNLHTIIFEGMELETRKEVKSLCDYFVLHCDALIQPILTRCGPEIMRHPIGEYELLVTEPPNDWIKKYR